MRRAMIGQYLDCASGSPRCTAVERKSSCRCSGQVTTVELQVGRISIRIIEAERLAVTTSAIGSPRSVGECITPRNVAADAQ
nr:hypothetical protein CFP56_12378 [Quercus suber]